MFIGLISPTACLYLLIQGRRVLWVKIRPQQVARYTGRRFNFQNAISGHMTTGAHFLNMLWSTRENPGKGGLASCNPDSAFDWRNFLHGPPTTLNYRSG